MVPFSDGNKTINVVTNLDKAYHSNGKQLIDDFDEIIFISNIYKNIASDILSNKSIPVETLTGLHLN